MLCKKPVQGFPGSPVVKNPPRCSLRQHIYNKKKESPPGATKPVCHATEPPRLEPMLRNKKSHRSEQLILCNEE